VPARRILLRATNWVGDAVMSLPALRAVREACPEAEITILARPWVADLYSRERFADHILTYPAGRGLRDLSGKRRMTSQLRAGRFDLAILFPNAFEAAAVVWMARIPVRIGYRRDGRGWLLTDPIEAPERGSIPRHESYYYLELLRRAGMVDELPESVTIRLDGLEEARAKGAGRLEGMGMEAPFIGVSPGAAFGGAKRWFPDRFAESACAVQAEIGGSVVVFGSAGEQLLCRSVHDRVVANGVAVRNLAGATSLSEFIEMASACRVFLTNDSGSMHIASAAGVPTVAVFGATDPVSTGPTGDLARVVREPVECSPCLLRECPIDHRCMSRVSAERVAQEALSLLK
jgi:heptosyltransferase-2